MKLSIIVPVYNMAADGNLRFCMDSLTAQTAKDCEIIAVDDASTDASLDILREYEKKYPGLVRVIASPQNHRQGGARNLGIQAARGEYIGFMDSDDWAAPEMFEKLLRKAQAAGADVVGCDYSLVRNHTMEAGKPVRMNTPEQTGALTLEKKKLLFLQPGSMVVKIYRRDVIVGNGLWFPQDIFYEDNCMAPLWMLYCTHFERVEEPLYYYYQHGNSTVHEISVSRCRDRMRSMELLVEQCRERGLDRIYPAELEFKFTELYLVNTLFSCMSGRMKGKYRFVGELWRGQEQCFPEFQRNAYYKERIGSEERKLIALLTKSRLLFLGCYQALQTYRKVRKFLRRG